MAQELKAYNVVATIDVNPEVVDSLGCTEFEAYDADEVDAVLAEKDKEIAELKAQVHDYAQGMYVVQARAEKEARHQKYKRCLAMARVCRLRARWFGDNAFYKKEQWALQWRKRWLELAEKFKLNQTTAQQGKG